MRLYTYFVFEGEDKERGWMGLAREDWTEGIWAIGDIDMASTMRYWDGKSLNIKGIYASKDMDRNKSVTCLQILVLETHPRAFIAILKQK